MIFSPAGAHRWSLLILIPTLFGPAVALAQGLPNVPNSVKTASSIGAAEKAALDAFITAAVAQLQAPTVDLQTKARQALESDAKVNGQPGASPAYLDAYTQILNEKLKPLAGDPNLRVRLNAAIAATAVAQLADNPHLKDAALAFLADKNDTVVLWGMKLGRWIIPAQLRSAFGGQPDLSLVKVIVPTVKAHPNGTIAGAIASDAYDALALDVFNPARKAKLTPAMHQAIAPYVLELLGVRVELYRQGVPPSPRAEATGTRYLSDPAVWAVLNDEQRVRVMQAFSDLIALAAEQLKPANALDQIDLKQVISLTAKAIASAADPSLNGPVAIALKPLFNINKDTPVTAVVNDVKGVLPALRAIDKFKALKDPPPIVDTKPAPPPASAPTTGPVAPVAAGDAPAPTSPAPAPVNPVPPNR